MSKKPSTALLVILDGWGINDNSENNAIAQASTPVWDRLLRENPHAAICTSGATVGLPAGQMGNSEVGHMNIGAGRVVYQEFTRVNRSISTGSFFTNLTLTDAVDLAIENNKAVHVLGLLSDGGVHSHEDHLLAMLKLAADRGAKKIYLHAFLDGRDTPPKSAAISLKKATAFLKDYPNASIASLIGRFYVMDRDHRWERIQKAYNLMVDGSADFTAESAIQGLEMAYQRGETDEFVKATAIYPKKGKPVKIEDGDVVVSMNYRSDRSRQFTIALTQTDFDGFKRQRFPKLTRYISLTEYNKHFDIPVAFPAERLNNVFGEYISNLGLHQLRIAETEKFAHVTFFFNGGLEDPFEGEDRKLIPSPKVRTYDLQPEMSANEVTDELIKALESEHYDVIICNFANADMVGHSGKIEAAIKAVETLDFCLGRIQLAIHKEKAAMLITADHGNVEQMQDPETKQPYTSHTTNPVPLVYVGEENYQLSQRGALCDIAPTLLQLLHLEQPSEMTGHPLLEKITKKKKKKKKKDKESAE